MIGLLIDLLTKGLNLSIGSRIEHRFIRKVIEFSIGYIFTFPLIHLIECFMSSISIAIPSQALLATIIVLIEMILDNEDYRQRDPRS